MPEGCVSPYICPHSSLSFSLSLIMVPNKYMLNGLADKKDARHRAPKELAKGLPDGRDTWIGTHTCQAPSPCPPHTPAKHHHDEGHTGTQPSLKDGVRSTPNCQTAWEPEPKAGGAGRSGSGSHSFPRGGSSSGRLSFLLPTTTGLETTSGQKWE